MAKAEHEEVRESSPSAVAAALEAGDALLIDVREPAEWAVGHADGAVHVPLGGLTDALPRLESEASGRTLAFICRTGSRSGKAAVEAASGDVEVVNVVGGTTAWQEAGLPMVPGDGYVLDPSLSA